MTLLHAVLLVIVVAVKFGDDPPIAYHADDLRKVV